MSILKKWQNLYSLKKLQIYGCLSVHSLTLQEMPNLYLAVFERPLMNKPKYGSIVVWEIVW